MRMFYRTMNKYFYFLFSALFFYTYSFSQGNHKDTKERLQTEQLIEEIRKLSPNDSIAYHKKIKQAENLIRKNNFQLLKGSLFLRKAAFSYHNYQFALAETYADSAYLHFQTLKNQPEKELWEARALAMKAVFYGINGNSEKEQEVYLKLIPVYTKFKDDTALKNVYLNLGNIYFNKDQYPKALEYFVKSDRIKELSGNPQNIASGSLSIAMTYNEMKDSIQMERYLVIARNELSDSKDSLPQWAFYYHLRGQNELLKKNYSKAIEYNQKGLQFSEKIGDIDHVINNKGGLSTALYELGRYHEALAFEKDYYEYTQSAGKGHYMAVSLKRLADMEFKTGNTKRAYQYLDEYIQLADSIKEAEVTKKLHALEVEFQTTQKENEIAQLQYENERKDWQLQRNKIWLFGTIAAIISLFVVAFLLYRNIKNEKRIRLQEKDLHQFEVEQMEQKHQIEILSSLMRGTETERQRLGRDLHDGLGGLLSGIKLKLNSFLNHKKGKHHELETELRSDLDNAITEMRFISQSLLPDLLKKYGIVDALKHYCSRFSTEELSIHFQSVNVKSFPGAEKQLMFYRIAQELVNNAVKHSNATEIFVQLQYREHQFFLTVEDNGTGFDPSQMDQQTSGLINLKNRIDYLKGTLEISSSQGNGTSVFVTCPV